MSHVGERIKSLTRAFDRGEGCPIIRWRLVYETSRLLSSFPNSFIRERYIVGSTGFFFRAKISHSRSARKYSYRRGEVRRDRIGWEAKERRWKETDRERERGRRYREISEIPWSMKCTHSTIRTRSLVSLVRHIDAFRSITII